VKGALSAIEPMFDSRHSLPPLATILDCIGTTFVGPDAYAHLQNAESMFANVNTKLDLDRATDLQATRSFLNS
jgi:hypothetical protein